MELTLSRVGFADVHTPGVLFFGDIPRFCTLELPWRDNGREVSCIPVGFYVCERHRSPKFGETFWVKGVPGRSEIIFHAGNWLVDTRGCILLGMSWASESREPMLQGSRVAMNRFLNLLDGVERFELVVTV